MSTTDNDDSFSFLYGHAPDVAPLLLGCLLERIVDGQLLLARIVEVESYDQHDAASHSYKGRTPRTEIMFGAPGFLYVYFTYGMHFCCNVVTGEVGEGSAVLIRAVEPLQGSDFMTEQRHGRSGIELSNGPAKVCQALAIDKILNGHNLRQEPLQLLTQPQVATDQIVQTTRIGISQAKDKPWRFYIASNPYVSKRQMT